MSKGNCYFIPFFSEGIWESGEDTIVRFHPLILLFIFCCLSLLDLKGLGLPVLLPCGHSVCQACVQPQLKGHQTAFVCYNCKVRILVKTISLKVLNFLKTTSIFSQCWKQV